MLCYSKGRALLVFLKWMACLICVSGMVGVVVGVVNLIQQSIANGGLDADVIQSGMTSTNPWTVVVGNGLAWCVFMFWESSSIRMPWSKIVEMRPRPLSCFVPVIFIALGGAVLISEVGTLFTLWVPIPEHLLQMMKEVGDFTANPVGAVMALVVIAPLTEEVICRGLILRGMLARRVPAGTAVARSALLFAIMHMNPWQGVATFLLGLLWGWIYLRTRSLALCMLAHGVNNGLAIVAMNLPFLAEYAGDGSVPVFNPWWLNVIGAVLLATGVGALWLFTRGCSAAFAAEDAAELAKPPPLPSSPAPLAQVQTQTQV